MERANAGDDVALAAIPSPSHSFEARPTAFGDLVLADFSPGLRHLAVEAFEAGDVAGFLHFADNMRSIRIVYENADALNRRGIYEKAFLYAYTLLRTNASGWSTRDLRELFRLCDRERLRAAGDPLPGRGPFMLYRGVAGTKGKRRERGLSWTSSRTIAQQFALRFARDLRLDNPVILSGVFSEPAILAYTNGRKEQEFIVNVSRSARLSAEPIRVANGDSRD